MRGLIGAVLGGLIAGAICIMTAQVIGHVIYPPPADMDWEDREAVAEMIRNAPVPALGIVIAGYVVGAAVGGFVASVISRSSRTTAAATIGGLFLVAGIANLISIPHPQWFVAASLLVFIPAALVGGQFGILLFPRNAPSS